MLYTDLHMSINSEIIEFLEDGKLATIREIAQHIKLPRNRVAYTLRYMTEENTLVRHQRQVGRGPYLKYSLAQNAHEEVA